MDLHQSSSVREDEFHFWSSNSSELDCYSLSEKFEETLSFSSSPLLPWNHHYSNGSLSPSSRTRQIEQSRKELMEIIRTMPMTSFELSLKDIVDDVKNLDEATKEQKKNAKNVPSKVLRCSSMDNGDSLIKKFLPSCLSCSKKKHKNLGPSVVSPRTSVNAVDKDSWIKKSQELCNKSCRWRICRFCRNASVESSPRCWPFGMGKSRMRR